MFINKGDIDKWIEYVGLDKKDSIGEIEGEVFDCDNNEWINGYVVFSGKKIEEIIEMIKENNEWIFK
ncbi:MAG: hypothetical protein ACOCP8_05910 [archaeon]